MMENNLQRMFAYQEIMAQRGKESICHSAILRCEHGSERCVLNLPKSHGKYVGTHAQIDIKDGKNAFFGYCWRALARRSCLTGLTGMRRIGCLMRAH